MKITNTRRAARIPVIFAVCLGVIIAVLPLSCSGKKQEGALAPLRIGLMPALDSIPFVVAKQQGFLGDNVKLEIYKSPNDRDSALQSGSIDGSVTDMVSLLLFRQGAFNVVSIAKTNGRYGMVTYPGSGITGMSGLGGKQVALSLNSIMEFITDKFAASGGVSPNSVKKISVPQIPSRLELLRSRQVDAAVIPEPYITAARESGMVVLGVSDSAAINLGNMMVLEKAYNGKRRELRAFFDAYNKAVDYIHKTGSAAFMPGVIKEIGLPDSALGVTLPVYDSYTILSKEEFQGAVNWLREKALIREQFSYDKLVKDIHD